MYIHIFIYTYVHLYIYINCKNQQNFENLKNLTSFLFCHFDLAFHSNSDNDYFQSDNL